MKCLLSVVGGPADADFGQWRKTLVPGETIEVPWAVVACGTSLEEICDSLVKAQAPHAAEADADI